MLIAEDLLLLLMNDETGTLAASARRSTWHSVERWSSSSP
jgi:hypothetical protein